MKVLMVITEGDLGGAQRHVLDVSRELIRRGHEVIIAVGGAHAELAEAASHTNPQIQVIRLHRLVRDIALAADIAAVFEIWRVVRRVRPDIVHTHSSKAGAVASVGGALAGAAVVYTAHGFVFQESISWAKRLLYRVIERTATWFRKAVIAVSQSDAAAAIEQEVVPEDKIVTIPNGIDVSLADELLDPIAARAQLSEWAGADLIQKKVVLSIANLYPAKNIPLMIRAFDDVVRRVPHARLVIVGDGQQRGLCEAAIKAAPALHDKVFLVGKKPNAYRVLKGADLFCLSSTKEGMPYVLLEARLAGVPVVATRVGGVPEVAEGSDFKLVVPHAAEALAEAVAEMLLTHTPGGTSRLPSQFTLARMVDAIEGVYQRATDR